MGHVTNRLLRMETDLDLLSFGTGEPAWSPSLSVTPRQGWIDPAGLISTPRKASQVNITPKANQGLNRTTPATPNLSARFSDDLNLDAVDRVYHSGLCICPACSGASRTPTGETSANVSSSATSASSIPVADLQTLANYLTTGYWQEAGTYTRQYNLSSSGTGAKNGTITYNITGWTNDSNGLAADRQTLTREVFKLYSAILGINFKEVTGSGGDIRFTDNDTGAYAYMASGWYADSTRTNVIIDYSVVNVEAAWYDGKANYNTYTPQTIFHEIGHALGLGHQGQYNYTGTPLTYASSAQFANDSWQATMMSYWDQADNTTTGASFAWLQTPMAVDWLALNAIYGSQGLGTTNAFRGDTIYGVGTNISSSISDIWNKFSTYAGLTAYTIVDGDGYDTLDVSNFSANQLINLAPSQPNSTTPSISNIGGKTGNLSIAAGTIIEAAKGGSGNDSFYGNNANNSFWGNGGDDSFYDSLGSDVYYGDAGIDWLYFTESIDLFGIQASGDSLLFSRLSGSSNVDQAWKGLENISFNNIAYTYDQLLSSLTPNGLPMVTIDSVNGSLSSGAITNGTALTFSGSVSEPLAADQSIAFYRNGIQVGTGVLTTPEATSWTFTLQEATGTNNFSYTARVVGTAGVSGTLSSPFVLTVDTIAPQITVDKLTTNDTTPLIGGTVNDPAALVSVTIGGLTQTAVNDGLGRWSLQWTTALTAGTTYDVMATGTDAAGNSTSDSSGGELIIRTNVLYFSLASSITTASSAVLGGLKANNNDIIAFDGQTFTTWLDGNASGLTGAVLRDFHILSANEVVMAFNANVTLSGIAFDDSDLAKLTRTASGFAIAMYFDGSDVGLTTSGEAIDAITGLPNGSLLISTRGSGGVSGVSSFAAEDILRFAPTSLGATTSGSWSLYADMSDVGISGTSENVSALAVGTDSRLYLSTAGNASATGLVAANEDVFAFQSTQLGATTSGAFQSPLFFDGSVYGLGANAIQGLALPV